MTADIPRRRSVDETRGAVDPGVSSVWTDKLLTNRLDVSIPTPLYHQIYLIVRGLIESGSIVPGSLLPGENALAALFSVSRITVKRALNELASDKLVTRHRGRGTQVVGRPKIPVVRSSFDNLLGALQQMGLATEIELLEVGETLAGAAGVAKTMRLAPDVPLQKVVRRRKLEGEPLSYLVSFTPMRIANRYDLADLAQTPFLTLLKRAGADVTQAEQWITAVAAEPDAAAALGVGIATPLLRIERLMLSAQGETVQLIFGFYRPDRFQYHVVNDALQTGRRKKPRAAP